MNYALIGVILLVVAIIAITAFLGVQKTKVHIDPTKEIIEKNITVLSKTKSTLTTWGSITDTDNTTYSVPEQTYHYMKLGTKYTITVSTLSNGSGQWIETYKFINETAG
jgi:hypothetical protein